MPARPNSKTLIGLQSFVVEHGCDIGIATDGDADRLGVIAAVHLPLFPTEDLRPHRRPDVRPAARMSGEAKASKMIEGVSTGEWCNLHCGKLQ